MIEFNPSVKVILLLYASSTTSADPIRNSGGSHFSGHENLSYRNAPRSIQRRPSHPNSLQHSGPPDPYLNQNRPHLFLRSLVAREAKSKKHSTAPPAKPKATPQQAKVLKVEQKEKTKQKKAQESVAKNEKKAQVQKSKDQKLVNDNLKLETKGQNKAAVAAQKNVQKAQSQYNKDIENENKKLAKDERNANNHLAKAQREFSKQKGRKSEGKARENLAKDQFAAVRVSKEHDKRLQQLGQKTSNELGKNSRNLEKGLTKAHNDNFDANGKAKQHLNTWQKFKKVAKTILIEGAIAIGGAALAIIPGGALALAGITAARVGTQAGIRAATQGAKSGAQAGAKNGAQQGIKKGSKEGTKQRDNKSGSPSPLDHKVANVQQVAQSQRNKDLQVGNVMKSQNELMAKIKLNPGGRVRRRELLEWIYFQFDKEAEVEEDDDEGEGEYDDDYDDDEGNR